MQASTALPELAAALGPDGWRVQGLTSWAVVGQLGARNHASLRAFLQHAATRALTAGDRDAARDARAVLSELDGAVPLSDVWRPLLPRLRRESFRRDERVCIYVGDTPGIAQDWVQGTVTAIDKSYRKEWRRAQPNSAYYWRITVGIPSPVPGLPTAALSFSTSEPRAIPSRELRWLVRAQKSESPFLAAYAKNAHRTWQPLWCEELRLEVDTAAMAFLEWLGSAPPLAA